MRLKKFISSSIYIGMFFVFNYAHIYGAQVKRSKQASRQEFIRQKKQQRERLREQRVVQARIAKAKYNIGRAQGEINRALERTKQVQGQQATQRVLQKSSREIMEASAQLDQALAVAKQKARPAPKPILKSALKKKPAPVTQRGSKSAIKKGPPPVVKQVSWAAPDIKPIHVDVVRQQGTECGYWAALDAVILFNALKTGSREVQEDAAVLLRDARRMRAHLQEVKHVLERVARHRYDMSLVALDEGAIADIMIHYAHMQPTDYSAFSIPLPYKINKLPGYQEGIVNIIRRLKRTPQALHIFFLRSGSESTQAIGHWIAVVVHNTGKELNCYIIDSLKSSWDDDTWQRLLSLIKEA